MHRALLLTLAVAAGLGAWALLRSPADHALDGTQGREPASQPGSDDLLAGRAPEAESRLPGRPRLGGPPRQGGVRGGTLVGRVLRPGGLPASGALVWARPDVAPTNPAVETRAAVDGSFRLVGLPAGLLRVRASLAGEHPQLETMAFATADTDELELRLVPRVWELRVRVVDNLGALVPTFRCRVLTSGAVRMAGGKAGMAVLRLGTDWTGSTKIDPGEQPTFVEVWDARDGEGRALDCGVARVGPIEAQGEELRVSLPTGHALRGRLLRPDGTPAQGVGLRVSAAAGGKDVPHELPAGLTDVPLEDISLEVITDDQGRFDGARLSPTRSHRILVEEFGPLFLPLERVVGPAEDIGDLHLRAALTVEVRVLHADGAPQPGVLVRARPADPDAELAATFAESPRAIYSSIHGVAVLTGLDPEARYDLEVTPPGEGDVDRFALTSEESAFRNEVEKAVGLGPVRLPRWRPRAEVVRMPLALPLEGLVVDEGGQPVGAAFVEIQDLAGWRWDVWADADGRFDLAQPPAGPLLLRAALQKEALKRRAPGGAPVRVEEAARRDVRLSVALAGSVLVIVRGERRGTSVDPGVPDDSDPWWPDNYDPHAPDPVVLAHAGHGWAPEPDAVVALGTPSDEQRAAEVAGEAVRCYRIVGLRPGVRHALWQHLPEGGHVYGEIPLGARVLRLREDPGGSIRVRVRGSAADEVVEVTASDALGRVVRCVTSLDEGETSVPGLPRGEWDIRVVVKFLGGRRVEGGGSVRTGSVLDLDLKAPIR